MPEMSQDMQILIDTVETWNMVKQTGREFNTGDMRKFIEQMNFHTRKLIRTVQKENPEFWTGMFELATHACSMTTPGSKIFGDGIDRTSI